MALVYTKFGENYQAINAATEAINIDSNNEKAYFRRGDARIATKDYEQGNGLILVQFYHVTSQSESFHFFEQQ